VLTLEGRNVLVTGASRGIGREASLLMARLGARVAFAYARDAAAAGAAAAQAGGGAVAIAGDLAQPGAAEKLVAAAEQALGPLDVLVANHGIWKRAPIETMTHAEWSETLELNLGSVRALCSEAARRMLPRGRGAIVLVASTAGQRGEPFYSHYAASKGALIALTRSRGPRSARAASGSTAWLPAGSTPT
jgi:NAD(P)-dependent dehydrogenase (short-subunit alcohol dehydrogenase family)